MRFLFITLIIFFLTNTQMQAHPMPSSVLLLDIKANGVSAELQWPLKELQLAFPDDDIDGNPKTLLARKGIWLDRYLHAHLSVVDSNGDAWTVSITGKRITETRQMATGPFREVLFNLWLEPPAGSSPRHFTMHYDAVMHQVVTHKLLIRIRQDWDGGLSAKDSLNAELGLLMMNTSDNTIPPLIVNLDEGSKWKGFKSMVSLGTQHISEGTDHLLFLLVLMLPAPLLAFRGKWAGGPGSRPAAMKLLKIATAFTIGHSLTLLAGAIGWLRLPSQPVELFIALSVFVGAIHALRPIFPGRELVVASGFGLVHGLAFAGTLADLNLGGARMALSILGFNSGIELMQLFVILLVVPWLIVLSHYTVYRWVRISGAAFALIAALAWMAERLMQKTNAVAALVQQCMEKGQWIVLFLALLALTAPLWLRKAANAAGKI